MILKKIFSLLIVSIYLSSCLGQEDKGKKFADLITPQSASKHLHIIASDDFEGRETGQPGAEKAAAYIADEFEKIGLSGPINGAYFQSVDLVEEKFEIQHFSINDKPLQYADDFFIVNNRNSKKIATDSLVFIGYGISDTSYDDLKGIDISGKAVLLINTDEPLNAEGISTITGTQERSEWSTSRNKRIQHIMSLNPELILAASPDVLALLERAKKTGLRGRMRLTEDVKPQSAEDSTQPTVVYLPPTTADLFLTNAQSTYDELKAAINETGEPKTSVIPASINLAYQSSIAPVKAENVLGFLEGSDLKDELIVISAHYDHIGVNLDGGINNGADDDGSGVTGILEIAQAFSRAKAEGHGPRRSILFLAVVGEEKGLLGSDFYTRHPIFPLEATITNLNIDMIGRIDPEHEEDPHYVYLVGSDKLSSTLHQISEDANNRYTQLKLDYRLNDPNDPERIYYRSDHYNFAKNGIPVIFYFNGIHKDYHDVGDTVDKIDFDLLAERSRLVFYTAWELVNRDERPAVDSDKK